MEEYSLTVRESTLHVVSSLINSILDEIGDYSVDKITRKKAQQLVKIWPSKYKSFRKYKTYASQIMDYAVDEGAIKTTRLIKSRHHDKKKLSKMILKNFIQKMSFKLS